MRALLLHKLMEEVLTGELVEDIGQFADRARALLAELAPAAEGDPVPDYDEIAATTWRTLQLPDIAALRSRLVPKWPIYALLGDRPSPSALAGRMDAIAFEGNQTEVVVDWKSDIHPDETDMRPTRNSARGLSARHGRTARRTGIYDDRRCAVGNDRRDG